MNGSIRQYLKLRYLLYFFALVAGWPCVFYLLGWLPHYRVNYLVLLVVAFFYAALVSRFRFRLPGSVFRLLVFQMAVWLIYYFVHGADSSYFTRILMLLITAVFLALQMRRRDEFIRTYNSWVTVQSLAGTLGAVLVLVGVLRPLYTFLEMDMRTGYFFGLFTTNTYVAGFVRNAGFFDEPGALAFWGIYALLINKLFIKNVKAEVLLIFGLISTLSLAYFVQLALYVWFFYKKQQGKLITMVAAFMIALTLAASFNSKLEEAIFGRFKYDASTGTFAGDNRSELAEVAWKLFLREPVVGNGAKNLIEVSQRMQQFVGANPFTPLATDGIIGLLVMWSPFFFLWRLRRKKYRAAVLILIAGFMQRPYDATQLLYPLMSFTIVFQAYMACRASTNRRMLVAPIENK